MYEDMDVNIIHPSFESRERYYTQIREIIRQNVDDFVVWESYADPESEYGVDLRFFNNYRRENNDLLIAKQGDTVCGFLTYDGNSMREDIPIESPFTYISLLIVDEPYRGNGIASQLYEHLLNGIVPSEDTAYPIVLGTWEGNSEQKHLMDKFGFTICGRKPHHRENGEATLYYSYQPE